MAKYHISPKTGRANVCRAQKQCPLGDIPHFENKQEAENFLQESLEKAYSSFSTVDKDSEEFLNRVWGISQVDTNAYSVDQFIKSLDPESDIDIIDTIEEPDYFNTVLVRRGDQLYSARTSGGDYSGFNLLTFNKVTPVKVQQQKAVAVMQDSVTQMNSVMKEIFKNKDNFENNYAFRETDGKFEINAGSVHEPMTIERKDGSKIHIFNIAPIGDRSFQDEPFPVEIPNIFTENGQRQNSRRMDRGMCIYDTQTDTGVLFKWQSASDGEAQHSYYSWDKKKIKRGERPNRWAGEAGDLYLLQGINETQEVEFYKNS